MSTSDPAAAPVRCPCLSGDPYAECCAPYHRGAAVAPTAERLMRSRYSAFAIGDAAYLLATWHPQTRPDPAGFALDDSIRWYRLDILGRSGGGVLDSEGEVEFVAHHKPRPTPDATPRTHPAPVAGRQHERSRFVRENGRWFYLDAV